MQSVRVYSHCFPIAEKKTFSRNFSWKSTRCQKFQKKFQHISTIKYSNERLLLQLVNLRKKNKICKFLQKNYLLWNWGFLRSFVFYKCICLILTLALPWGPMDPIWNFDRMSPSCYLLSAQERNFVDIIFFLINTEDCNDKSLKRIKS